MISLLVSAEFEGVIDGIQIVPYMHDVYSLVLDIVA